MYHSHAHADSVDGLGAVFGGDATDAAYMSEALDFLGVPSIVEATTSYRDQLEARTRAYQIAHGRDPLGKPTADTLSDMYYELVSLYSYMSAFDSPVKWQLALNLMLRRGGVQKPIDGNMRNWRSDVDKVQRAMKLPVTSQWDAATQNGVRSAILGWLATESYRILRLLQYVQSAGRSQAATAYSAYSVYSR